MDGAREHRGIGSAKEVERRINPQSEKKKKKEKERRIYSK